MSAYLQHTDIDPQEQIKVNKLLQAARHYNVALSWKKLQNITLAKPCHLWDISQSIQFSA
jgi:hypothetical protein